MKYNAAEIPLNLRGYKPEKVLLAAFEALEVEQSRYANRAVALFELHPTDDVANPDRQGAGDNRMSEAYGTTKIALEKLIVDHNRSIARAISPNYAKLTDAEIDAIIASVENY